MNAPTDDELLQDFRARRDEAAFAELMRRHGDTVQGAARAVLGQVTLAEDVVQATFLTLARKADRLQGDRSLAGWLYRVAICLARNVRRGEARRLAREKEAAMLAAHPDAPPAVSEAASAALHEAISDLSATYRAPLVLHYFEGKSYGAAASELGLNENAFGVRLTRAREKLRQRLLARGVTLGADGVTGALEESATSVALPAALIAATCQAASLVAAGKTLTGTGLVSAKVAYLTKSAMKMLFWAKVKTAAAVVVLTAGVAVGGGLAAQQMLAHRGVTVPVPAPAPGGQVWAWGGNDAGQLGDGTTASRANPVPVPGLVGVTALAAGRSHTAALLRDGGVRTWGANDGGQLGDGTTTARPTPVPVRLADGTPFSGVTAIAAGGAFTVALRRDGQVWSWGQIGAAPPAQRPGPVPVTLPDGAVLSGVSAIAAGRDYAVALKGDRTVWTWGANNYGQLGDGTTTGRASPVPVAGLTDVIAIAGGDQHTVALKGDRTVWTWGRNHRGQLGDGTGKNNHTSPVLVKLPDGAPLAPVTAIAGGWNYTVALRADGSLWGWGENKYGQLGDGTTAERRAGKSVTL